MPGEQADLLETFDYVWQRLWLRMDGLTDDEWEWHPVADEQVSLHWRLEHIADLLAKRRNARWLGVPEPPDRPVVTVNGWSGSETSAAARDTAQLAYTWWRSILVSVDDVLLGGAIGPPGGQYAGSTRRSFALHVLDELTHHTGEAALLRDLYAGRPH